MKKYNIQHCVIGSIIWVLVTIAELGPVIDAPYFWKLLGGYLLFFVVFLLLCFEQTCRKNIVFFRSMSILELGIALTLIVLHPGPRAPLLLVLWASKLPLYFSNRTAIILILLSNILLVVWWNPSDSLIFSTLFLGLQLFVLFAITARISEQLARESVEHLNQQLMATRILLAQASRQEERLRISRDLHDILGHQLTALSLRLEMLYHKADDTLRNDVIQAKEIAKELLDNIRQVVRDQRRDLALDIGEAMRTLIARLPNISLHVEGTLQIQSSQLAEQLILCLQEGVSNALRHGNANGIHLRLHQEGNHIRILLDDNGKGYDNPTNSGTGITGMRERLAPYSGIVELSPLATGCRLTISLGAESD